MASVNNRRELDALSDAQKLRRKAGLAVVARARRQTTTIGVALRREREAGHDVILEDVLDFASEAVTTDARGRLTPTRSDSIYRRISFLTTGGVREVDTWSSREATLIGLYRNAVKAYEEGLDATGEGILGFRA